VEVVHQGVQVEEVDREGVQVEEVDREGVQVEEAGHEGAQAVAVVHQDEEWKGAWVVDQSGGPNLRKVVQSWLDSREVVRRKSWRAWAQLALVCDK
jgi:hypothetical protein